MFSAAMQFQVAALALVRTVEQIMDVFERNRLCGEIGPTSTGSATDR